MITLLIKLLVSSNNKKYFCQSLKKLKDLQLNHFCFRLPNLKCYFIYALIFLSTSTNQKIFCVKVFY